MAYPSAVGEFSLRIASDAAAAPRLIAGPAALVDFVRERRPGGDVQKGFPRRRHDALRLHTPADPRSFRRRGTVDGLSRIAGGAAYCAASAAVQDPDPVGQLSIGRGPDLSERDRAAGHLFPRCAGGRRAAGAPGTAELTGVFRVSKGEWPALRAALEATVYDGGTRLDDVPAETWAEENLFLGWTG